MLRRKSYPKVYLAKIICRIPNFEPQVALLHPNIVDIQASAINNTYKYAGRMAHMRLNPTMTRQESRTPRPKLTGPMVPIENLQAD